MGSASGKTADYLGNGVWEHIVIGVTEGVFDKCGMTSSPTSMSFLDQDTTLIVDQRSLDRMFRKRNAKGMSGLGHSTCHMGDLYWVRQHHLLLTSTCKTWD